MEFQALELSQERSRRAFRNGLNLEVWSTIDNFKHYYFGLLTGRLIYIPLTPCFFAFCVSLPVKETRVGIGTRVTGSRHMHSSDGQSIAFGFLNNIILITPKQ